MHQDKKIAELEEMKEFAKEEEFEIEIEKENELGQEKFETIEMKIEDSEVIEKKKRREVVFEMALFFVLGILLGVTIKTEAIKKITIGFNDYQIKKYAQSYDVADLKKSLEEQIAKQSASAQPGQAAEQQGN